MIWVKRILIAIAFVLGLALLLLAGLFLGTRGEYPVAATVMDDPNLPAETVADIRLHLKVVGADDAPSIIVLHGGPGGDFRSLLGLQALSDTHRLVFYDQRGAGLSQRVSADRLTLDGYLDELNKIIDTHANGQAILIGHSWGAMLASAYMGTYPDKVTKAVLIEPGFLSATDQQAWQERGKSFMSGFRFYWAAALNLFRMQNVSGPDPSAANDFLSGAMAMHFANHPDNPYHCPDRAYDAPNWRFGSLANLTGARAPASDLDRLGKGAEYPGPVLFMAGSCDDWIGEPLQRRYVETFANAQLKVIDDAGHDIIWDQPETTIEAIRLFLAE